jgi:ElaB/YqjD/DUF883 family membrane-anchored ribosome-binding protein
MEDGIMYKTPSKKHHRRGNLDLSNDIAKIKAALTDTAKDVHWKASDLLSSSAENIKDKSTEIQDGVSDYVAQRPFKTLALAMFTGLFLGMIMRRSKRRR